ncbi:MAG: hypothetical protein H0W20_02595 [Chthoniobacterales bacterium]|nr:hypothetical protein [Chthoniobacterales bacterium]
MRKLFLLPLLLACSVANAQDLTPEMLVEKAIEHAGGWNAWTGTKTLQFRKTTQRFNEDGSFKETRVQFHKYVLHPSPQMRIDWEMNGSKGIIINNGKGEAWKFVNGKEATTQEDINGARGNTFGSHYVFCMPFKLRDPGTHLEDGGTKALEDGTTAQKVRIIYDKSAGDAGGMHHWTYLFDPQTGRLVANHLQYEPGKYDWTEYYDEKAVGSMLLSTRRVGYTADADGKVGLKRSETTYDQIETNAKFPRDLFKAPR